MTKFIEIIAIIACAGGAGFMFSNFYAKSKPQPKQPPSDVYQWLFENGVKVDKAAVDDLLKIMDRHIISKAIK